MTVLVVYPNSNGGDKYDIPDGVTEIYSHAFEGTEIKSVTIPGSVSVIGEKAFFECKNLKDVVMSDGIETIDEEAFAFCEALTEINLPDSVTDLGEGAFEGCKSLTSVKLSKNIASINESVFFNCTALSEIEIPENVSDIYCGAFMNCDSLTSIEISKDVILIEDYAFGFSLNDDLDRIINWNFIIYGYADSAAERYAERLGFRFVNMEGSDCKHKKTELKNAVEATCQHQGYTGDLVCLECGEIIAPGVKIFATGHRYVNGVCSVCGDIDPDYKSGLTSNNEQIKVNNEAKQAVYTPASNSGMKVSEFKKQFDSEISIDMDDNALIANGTKFKFGDSEFTVIVKGDVQADGKITASDARTILRISAKLDKADDAGMSAADVNGDGKVTAGEARQVLRFSAKLESTILSA